MDLNDYDNFKEDEGEAVQLVQPIDAESGDAGGFILNEKALEEIFCSDEVKYTPIAVYSLTGAFRKGKSFLLNLFLRYLWADKKEEWIGDTTERLSRGFGWRGGIKGDTQGIWIWNKPFLCDTPHGKVNLFLMDTQGAFDLEADVKTSSVIFALSTLIGSVQIYNVMQMIGADDLQNLQLFAEYGKTATSLAKKYQIENSKPFQHLIFLIRDWADKDYEFGEEGGKKYLETVFSKKSKSKEIKKVQKNIQNYFSKFTCYLLPSPGEKVMLRGAKDEKIQLSEIGDRFLSEVESLDRHLFEPKNIVVKTNNGKVMTGIELIHFFSDYFEIFKTGKMPKVDTILEANINASMDSVIMECAAVFNDNMRKMCVTYMGPKVFEVNQNSCRSLALTHFDETPKMGGSEFISAIKKTLDDQIKEQSNFFLQMNETFKEQLKAKVRDILEETVSTFKQDLNEASNNSFVDDLTLEEIKQNCNTNALKSFQNQTETFDESVIGQNNTKLEELLEIVFNEFKESNRYLLDDLKLRLSNLSLEAKQEFTSIIEEKCNGTAVEPDELEEAILKAQETAFAIFDKSEIGDGNGSAVKKESRLDLSDYLNAEKKKFTDKNELNLKLDEAQTLQTLTQAKDAYYSYVTGVCGEDYINPDKIENAHQQGKKQAEKMINLFLESKGESFVRKCRNQLDEVLADAVEELKSKNEIRKVKVLNDIKNMKIICFGIYKEELNKFTSGQYQDENMLLSKHNEVKVTSLSQYNDKCPKDPENERTSNKKELEADIEKHFLTIQKNNKHQEVLAKERANAQLESMKTKHRMKLIEVTGNRRRFDRDRLANVHITQKKALFSELEKKVDSTKYGQDVLLKFKYEVDQIYNDISATFREKKKRRHWWKKAFF